MKVVGRVTVACAGLLLALPGGVWAELTSEQKEKLPPAADHKVSFSKEIYPLLEQSCTKCHGKGKAKGGFSIETREQLLAGGDTGASVVVGNSAGSSLVELDRPRQCDAAERLEAYPRTGRPGAGVD